MDIVTRKQLNILIQLAEVDKHFSHLEREMIFNLAKKKQFPSNQVKELIRNPEPIGTLGALSSEQRFDYLYNIIDLMLADKKIFDTEVLFCKDIAIKLGFKKDVVEFLQEEIHEHTLEELKKMVFRKYT
ncbi:TerB family tellurite resistance protein [Fulvivirga sp. M361]|uniref:TerB family tellurite resistance protein n=1 Tax=Fulvivirga sp. M361 TaxID=2594266 RepID=UPI001179A75B|nr:TerB family tellurite resistance protein [Fulvivirga sp. M361]TRX61780.1 TerB family tellurite resistance protein [Fulvivirga sp. M361]